MNRIDMHISELPYAVEEALNRLRINVKFSGKNTQVILIVSSIPNEGKSFVSVHLWRLLSEAGFRSVLVDADLRKSEMKTRYGFNSVRDVKGLDYYLSGLSEYEDVVYETNISNGYLIPCAKHLENPSVLLEDPRFHELFQKLAKDFRYVIVDAPPLATVADGALIAAQCDGAIMVVDSGEVSKTLVKQSIEELERAGCRLLGTVLNKAEVAGRSYKYKYYGSYKYKYYGEYYSGNE